MASGLLVGGGPLPRPLAAVTAPQTVLIHDLEVLVWVSARAERNDVNWERVVIPLCDLL